ncbi:MAG: hypothetical protein JNN00_04575, partial [Chitinophagaceae bacterium]|nr:hypothetical protein [Chitinophagaceae bacterium]
MPTVLSFTHQSTIMQPSTTIPYRTISLFFVIILGLVTWGFYKTYLVFFPSFDGFSTIHHFHGAMMMTWICFLIVQPLLIRAGKLNIHRAIGRLSYVVAPLLMVSIFLVTRIGYYRPVPGMSHEDKIAEIALSTPYIPAFAVLYCLAIINRRNTYDHMRYMIGTSLFMIGPGLGRALIIYFGKTLDQSVDFTDFLSIGMVALLLLNDLLRKRSYKAFAIVLLVLICIHITWESR